MNYERILKKLKKIKQQLEEREKILFVRERSNIITAKEDREQDNIPSDYLGYAISNIEDIIKDNTHRGR